MELYNLQNLNYLVDIRSLGNYNPYGSLIDEGFGLVVHTILVIVEC